MYQCLPPTAAADVIQPYCADTEGREQRHGHIDGHQRPLLKRQVWKYAVVDESNQEPDDDVSKVKPPELSVARPTLEVKVAKTPMYGKFIMGQS